MDDALLNLLNTLEKVGQDHEELFDTDVKEQIADRFIKLFFFGETEFGDSNSYGMLSEEGNRAIHNAFATFADNLRKLDGVNALEEKAKWQLLDNAVTKGGQLSEHFFGALTPTDIKRGMTSNVCLSWLQSRSIYILFLTVPGILVVLLGVLAFPRLAKDPIALLALTALAGFASLYIGDYGYQRLADRTYRKRYRDSSKQA